MSVAPDTMRILERDERFAALLPNGLIGWFPRSVAGRALLDREARVLRLLERHCTFAAPRVLASGANWQLRQQVLGSVDPFATYQRVTSDRSFARELGAALGAVLAEQHLRIPPSLLVGWLPTRPAWPYPRARILADLPHVLDDVSLRDRCIEVIDRCEQALGTETPVLVHGDLGLHNIALSDAGTLAGVFDYAEACFTDHQMDFRYLLFDTDGADLLEAAIDAYMAHGGAAVAPERVALYNAAAAVGFLADRRGSGPEDRPAGRTLTEDLHWTRLALSRLG